MSFWPLATSFWGPEGLLEGHFGHLGGHCGLPGGGPGGSFWHPKSDREKGPEQEAYKGGCIPDFGGGIWDPKSTKIDPQKHPKIDAIFKRAKIALEEALGRSWGDLGAQRGAVLGARESKNELFAWDPRKKLRIIIFDKDGVS